MFTRGFGASGVYDGDEQTVSIFSSFSFEQVFTNVDPIFYGDATNKFARLFIRKVFFAGAGTASLFNSNPLTPTLMNTWNWGNGQCKLMGMGSVSGTFLMENSNIIEQQSPLDVQVSGLNFVDISPMSFIGSLVGTPFGGSQIKLSGATAGGISIGQINTVPAGGDTFIDLSGMASSVGLRDVFYFGLLGGGGVYAVGSKEGDDPLITVTGSNALPDSNTTIDAVDNNTQETTVIPLQNAKIIINKTGVVAEEAERMTATATGILDHTGLDSLTRKFEIKSSLEPVTATKLLSFGGAVLLVTELSVTFDNTTNIVVEAGHARSNGDIICFLDSAGTLPAELRKDALYYVVTAGVNDFQLSYTLGGAAIAFTDNGTPPNEYKVVDLHGLEVSSSISAANPITLSASGLSTLDFGDKIVGYVSNRSDAVNIVANNYQLIIN